MLDGKICTKRPAALIRLSLELFPWLDAFVHVQDCMLQLCNLRTPHLDLRRRPSTDFQLTRQTFAGSRTCPSIKVARRDDCTPLDSCLSTSWCRSSSQNSTVPSKSLPHWARGIDSCDLPSATALLEPQIHQLLDGPTQKGSSTQLHCPPHFFGILSVCGCCDWLGMVQTMLKEPKMPLRR